MNDLQSKIEGLLFALGRPVSYTELAKILQTDVGTVAEAVSVLKKERQGGIVLVDDGNMLELRTSQAAAAVIEQIRRDEYSREIGKAGLETLATVMYRGPLSRSEIDFIRGVNSSQTLRTLLMRGLVRRIPNPRDERSFLYEVTTEVLAQLGLQDPRDLPDYTDVKEKLSALEESYRNANA
ncbi:SMC-Scp complex subunit ScpB [Patescibacteria group bacterium]|nr:SMC-Scp complex subunit ScpB [Patescibacteria group bacterium]